MGSFPRRTPQHNHRFLLRDQRKTGRHRNGSLGEHHRNNDSDQGRAVKYVPNNEGVGNKAPGVVQLVYILYNGVSAENEDQAQEEGWNPL